MELLQYSADNLAIALSNSYTSPSAVLNKDHFIYFSDYFGVDGLFAKNIIIESDYISKDYLHDYATYYAFCFENYPKFCKRVHFFSNEFTLEYFQNVLIGVDNDNPDFWSGYLGFIVVKPIPTKNIGYTVLKMYDSTDNNPRYFWGVRNYTIHLFGNVLTIQSLAFQEQDTVLAACATTAIWTMLNKASVDFHTILKSPSQITKDADNLSFDGSRLFPNKGLNLLQICQAIYNSGLESEIKQPDIIIQDVFRKTEIKVVSNIYVKKILNAYSPIGIPIILVISVPLGQNYGLHAITVSGYNQNAQQDIVPQDDISWMASNIIKFYAHDDQWGPFARVKFIDEGVIETPWTIFNRDELPSYVINMVVPVYPKVRISYEDIEVIVIGLDTILTLFFKDQILSDLVWDIKIDYSENLKTRLKDAYLEPNEKLLLIQTSMPKYLWIASCYVSNFKIFDFTFDATDVNSGMFGKDVICYIEQDLKLKLVQFLETDREFLTDLFTVDTNHYFYDFLVQKLS